MAVNHHLDDSLTTQTDINLLMEHFVHNSYAPKGDIMVRAVNIKSIGTFPVSCVFVLFCLHVLCHYICLYNYLRNKIYAMLYSEENFKVVAQYM